MPADAPPHPLSIHGPLRRAIAHRALIEQAKGILIVLYRIDAQQAFDALRGWAAATDSTVVTVARTLVHAVCLEDDTRQWDHEVRAHVEAAVGRLDGTRLPVPAASLGPPHGPPRLRLVK